MFESELIEPAPRPEPIRRVVIELPESRALALSRAINNLGDWWQTEAPDELGELHEALGADWTPAPEQP